MSSRHGETSRAPLPILTTFVLLGLAALLASVPLRAAEPHAIIARGFEPDQIYDFNSIDNVNLFNGNLVVTIPIGQPYVLDGGFGYGFTLVYNSNIWDYVVDCPANGKDEYGETNVPELFLTDPNSASQACGGGSPPQNALRGIPNVKSNAGTGWRLTLGELYDVGSPLVPNRGWTFVGPDGAEHNFAPAEGSTSGTFPQFSRDGSHLRLRTGTASNTPACAETSGGCRVVERPDGVLYAFEPAATPAGWRLRRVEDRFGNGVSIHYSGGDWQVVDSVGREHWVRFDTSGMLSSVELAAFGDTTATWSFFTETEPSIKPGCPHNFDLPGVSELEDLVHLTAIQLPDTSRYELFYFEDDGSTLSCSLYEGRLERIVLPTDGWIDYEYGAYFYPFQACDPTPLRFGGHPGAELPQWGITRREARGTNNVLLAETIYRNGGLDAAPTHQSFVSDGAAVCIQPRTTFTDVFEKADGGRYRMTRNFFAIAQSQGDGSGGSDPDRLPGETFRYGLPIDHLSPDPALPDRFRSSMVFDCPAYPPETDDYGPNCVLDPSGGCWPADAWHLRIPSTCYDVNADGNTADRFLLPEDVRGLRDVYLEHEAGDVHYCDGSFGTNPMCERANWRVKSDRTYFFDSPGDYHLETSRSDFDQYGHYRSVTTRSNSPNSPSHTSTTAYRPEVTTTRWLLGLFDATTETEGGQTSQVSYQFDRSTGFLEQRTLHRTGGNLVADFEPDAFGNVETEAYSGGDAGQRGYFVRNEFENGTLSYSAFEDGGRTILRTVDADIDRNTGLPSASRDSSNLETRYVFDRLGRLTRMTQQGAFAEAATDYLYTPASGSNRASVRVDRGDTRSWIYFDGLGRANETHTLLPGGVTNRQFTIFTPRGQPSSVTTLHDLAALSGAQKTETDYDIFGRPTRIDNPDQVNGGFQSRITFFYEGIFKTVRRVHDVETPDGPRRLQTRFLNDHQGRLIAVEDTELPETGGATLKLRTRYSYDEGGRLVRVNQGGGTQVRTFDYDGAGLLTRECHPELAGGCVTYGGFDAQGNHARLRYSQAAGDPFELDYLRDGAARLTQVRSAQDGRILKEFFFNNFFGQSFGPTSGNGKLYQAKRHNYLDSRDLVATTTHSYSGIGGRLSETTVATGGDGDLPRARFTTTFAYDSLGNLAALGYPGCDQVGCGANDPPSRTVTRTHTRGLLTAVGTAADADSYGAFKYHPNLTLAEVLHGNGVRDDLAQDPSQRPRPGGIEVRTGVAQGAGALWQATYGYDGAGNLISRTGSGFTNGGSQLFSGADSFRYDNAFNRLVSATVQYPSGVSGATATQGFAYDPFGNLTAVTGSSSRVLASDPASNRLLAPFSYDAAGNLTSQPAWDVNGNPVAPSQWFYSYDPFNMTTRVSNAAGSIERTFVYTADDERLAVLTGGRELWTLRDPGARVLRDVEYLSTGWSWVEDYVQGAGGLLASESDTAGTRHYHLDHLGTPRLVTDGAQTVLARHVHAPYGEELTSSFQDELRMKFTGHERDTMDPNDPDADLDYMHARYHSPSLGRFLSADPLMASAVPAQPQTWNRYSYVSGNPLKYIDPSGMAKVCVGADDSEKCVSVDGDGDGDSSDDDLAPLQIKVLSEAYGEFIAENDGADLKDQGTKVKGGRNGERALIRAASQFVGANLENGWQNTEIVITRTGLPPRTAGRMDHYWRRGMPPEGIFKLKINPSEAEQITNPSSIARTLVHEFLHREDLSLRSHSAAHRAVDDEAKRLIKSWGLAGRGCPAYGGGKYLGFGPQFYSGC